MEISMEVPQKKKKLELPYDSAIPLGVHSKECQSTYTRDMLIATLATRAKLWNQSRYPSTHEWIKKMWHIYTKEYCSVTNNNKIMSSVGKWVELAIIIAVKARLRKTNIACSLSYVESRPQKK
jgi:hypothetical protein